ncbi:hypothetical protein SIO70_27070 [Chitinophaga sancti]|uniref:hypothetical protein n=1 Tax=Chitinophaga sancti TaxID=1004 RepID=UPI002A7501B6|nr:hypothetical protein [Chitinophaga sancti]WPQ62027.1 hypothetical protein SIO70_27070 [Chitinophaga sancti]
MYKLVQEVEVKTRQKFSTQARQILTPEKDEIEVPIPFVAEGVKKKDSEAVEKIISHSPVHEIAVFNALLQAFSWMISTLEEMPPSNK